MKPKKNILTLLGALLVFSGSTKLVLAADVPNPPMPAVGVPLPPVEAVPNTSLPSAADRLVANDEGSYPIYRSYHPTLGDHLYSLNSQEGPIAGYTDEGVAFKLFGAKSESRIGLYRCYIPQNGDHFISQDSACEKQHPEGLLGYAESAPVKSAPTALYRCYHARGYHLETVNKEECVNNNFKVEGIIGYVP